MRNRLWYELTQAKYNEKYVSLLIGHNRQILNAFNIIITVFSTGGVMGWKFWTDFPAVACIIIAIISLLRIIQPNIIPSDKQIEKLDRVADFYFDFFLKLEKLWFEYENDPLNETTIRNEFHQLKQTEREINKTINEIHKKSNKTIMNKAKNECDLFFSQAFNTINHE